MAELAERMALPEMQTKEIATLELVNRDRKVRRDELNGLRVKATAEVEGLADQISRARIATYAPAAQEAAIKERISRNSAIRVQEIIDAASKLVDCGCCKQILETPVTLVPCGHSVCYSHRFHQMERPVCAVCGEHSARAFVDNALAIVHLRQGRAAALAKIDIVLLDGFLAHIAWLHYVGILVTHLCLSLLLISAFAFSRTLPVFPNRSWEFQTTHRINTSSSKYSVCGAFFRALNTLRHFSIES
jgi:hypothetical protein